METWETWILKLVEEAEKLSLEAVEVCEALKVVK